MSLRSNLLASAERIDEEHAIKWMLFVDGEFTKTFKDKSRADEWIKENVFKGQGYTLYMARLCGSRPATPDVLCSCNAVLHTNHSHCFDCHKENPIYHK